jgi:hypothetical protein
MSGTLKILLGAVVVLGALAALWFLVLDPMILGDDADDMPSAAPGDTPDDGETHDDGEAPEGGEAEDIDPVVSQLRSASVAMEAYHAEHGEYDEDGLGPEYGFTHTPAVQVQPVVLDGGQGYCLEGHGSDGTVEAVYVDGELSDADACPAGDLVSAPQVDRDPFEPRRRSD